MISEVKGLSEAFDATAKEENATSSGMPLHIAAFNDWENAFSVERV